MRKLLIQVVLVNLLLTGCARTHNLTLHPRNESLSGQGVAQEAEKTVTINLNGKVYSGTYAYDGRKVATLQIYNNATAYAGAKSASASGGSFGTAYVPGSGNGRVLAIAADGDAIRCEFQYSSGSGIGICRDNSGKDYDLLIHN